MAITSTTVDLEWSAAIDDVAVTDYKVYLSTDGITYDSGTSVGNVTSYTYPGLTADTPYWFKITSLDAALNESYFSNVVTATTLEYLLDTYTGAAAAYSLRRLATDGTYGVEVRRSSDNALTNVELELSTSIDLNSTVSAGGNLGTWVGANSAYIRTWYDQSGNGNDVTQTTNAQQPQLIDAGALLELNSLPTIKALSVNSEHLMINGVSIAGGAMTMFNVMASIDNTTDTYSGLSTSVTQNYHAIGGGAGNSSYHVRNTTVNSIDITSVNDTQYLLTGINRTTTDREFWRNSLSVGTSNVLANSTTYTSVHVNRLRQTDEITGDGFYQELIVFPSNESSNRTAIETDINNFYSIY